jgi:hypothetical protein
MKNENPEKLKKPIPEKPTKNSKQIPNEKHKLKYLKSK